MCATRPKAAGNNAVPQELAKPPFAKASGHLGTTTADSRLQILEAADKKLDGLQPSEAAQKDIHGLRTSCPLGLADVTRTAADALHGEKELTKMDCGLLTQQDLRPLSTAATVDKKHDGPQPSDAADREIDDLWTLSLAGLADASHAAHAR